MYCLQALLSIKLFPFIDPPVSELFEETGFHPSVIKILWIEFFSLLYLQKTW